MKTKALLSAVVIGGLLAVPHAAFSRDEPITIDAVIGLTDGTIMMYATSRDAGI